MSNQDNTIDDSSKQLQAIIGIVLGFVLNFFGQWSIAPGHWQVKHIVPIVTLTVAVLFLLYAFISSLSLANKPSKKVLVINLFIASIIFVLIAILVTIYVGAIS